MQGCCVWGKKKKNADEEEGGREKVMLALPPSLPISVSQSDEVIKHQLALYINDVTAREFWTPCPWRLLAAEEDFIVI